jgi:peroxiredoxin family protein
VSSDTSQAEGATTAGGETVDLQTCQITVELMADDDDDFYEGVTTGVGAATALQHVADADVQLLA